MSAVLLYYKYVDLSETRSEVAAWFQAGCERLQLLGRVRVALDGINVTLGGALGACQEHVTAVRAHPILRGHDIDFKLSDSSGPANSGATKQSGFDRLVVRTCPELVTLGVNRGRASPANTAARLSPQDFHRELCSSAQSKDVVLIDTRNAYEWKIGHFDVAQKPTLKSGTRSFSEWPAWVEHNEAALRGKRILMYCTGGVRCERASAYLWEKGPDFQDIAQLQGGIVRYLESYPSGGFFRGRNFVFDERISERPAAPGGVVGACVACGAPHDAYSDSIRCCKCRTLLLLCGNCEGRRGRQAAGVSEPQEPSHLAMDPDGNPQEPEELVQMHGSPCVLGLQQPAPNAAQVAGMCDSGATRADVALSAGAVTGDARMHEVGDGNADAAAALVCGVEPLLCSQCACRVPAQVSNGDAAQEFGGQRRRARLLALHGFRENASRFRGRLRGLLKRMRQDVEVVFITAPHALPPASAVATSASAASTASKFAWFIDPADCDGNIPVPGGCLPGADAGHARHAAAGDLGHRGLAPKAAPGSGALLVASQAGERQVFGWSESIDAVLQAVHTHGPFDGCLAFSQGCAMATLLVALQELKRCGAAAREGDPRQRVGAQEACAGSRLLSAGARVPGWELQHRSEEAVGVQLRSRGDCTQSAGPGGRLSGVTGARAAHEAPGSINVIEGTPPQNRHVGLCKGLQSSGVQSESWRGTDGRPPGENAQDKVGGQDTDSVVGESVGETSESTKRADILEAVRSCCWDLRFVILCSGHVGASPAVHEALHRLNGRLETPSLHVFGAAGTDQQVSCASSERLLELYMQPSVHRHDKGHIIPASRVDVRTYIAFIRRHCQDFV